MSPATRFAAALLAPALLAPGGAGVALAARAPVVYAHRGGAGLAPENTLGAFRQAHATFGTRGVWLEMDTQLDADGDLVIIHDATVDRTTDCHGRVMDLTTTQIQVCDAAAHWPSWNFEPVPTARQVLEEGLTSGWRIMIELKNIPGEPNFDATGTQEASALVALIEKTGFPAERLIVQSFFPTSLDYIELFAPAVPTALLTTSRLPGAPPGGGFPALSNGAYAVARGYEVSAPDSGSIDLSAETVAAIRALGRVVVPWTIDTPGAIAEAISWGVDGIISNRPDLVYTALGQ
ncbi:MAG: hypothetical protein HY775_08690 [Acidobacteria bacterium]|nr:hypothetical protein [Acidobacteriota bacterium]